MTADGRARLRELAAVCRRLSAARTQAKQLERRRDALVCALREAGVTGAEIASCAGLSPGRVTQIASGSPRE